MKAIALRFYELGRYSAFVKALSQKSAVLSSLGYKFPDKAAFEARIEELKACFDPSQRALLIERLEAQTSWNSLQLQQIKRLASPETFVVSTAHQPSFLGGPAYIPIKIASSIALCRQLKAWFPAYNFIPIHWLGSEDHDFDELGQVTMYGQLHRWSAQPGGPIGRKQLGDLTELFDQLTPLMSHKPFGNWAFNTLQTAFQPSTTLAQAMKTWLNILFEEQGLLIIDGDDVELKRRFAPIMEREFRESFAYPMLQLGAKRFEQAGFVAPLQGREINLFHLTNSKRDRFEPAEDGRWMTKSGDLQLSREEGAVRVLENPVEWSPNAVLRPLYQSLILPEVAFVGGGAEVAYWTQLQEIFAQAGIPQPLLVLRSSLSWAESQWWKKAEKAGFEVSWLTDKFQTWEEAVLKASGLELQMQSLEDAEAKLLSTYQQISTLVQGVDATLTGAAEAERQKAANGLEALKAKVRKAYKQKQEVQLRQLRVLYDKLFPQEMLQEREESIISALAQWGPEWIEIMIRYLNPTETEFILLVDEE